MPVYHGWHEVTQKYRIARNPIELTIGILNARDAVARNYASGIQGANAAVIEDLPSNNEFQKAIRKYMFKVYPIKIG